MNSYEKEFLKLVSFDFKNNVVSVLCQNKHRPWPKVIHHHHNRASHHCPASIGQTSIPFHFSFSNKNSIMTSWFGSAGLDLNSAFDTLTETVQSVTESVSEAIPTEHKQFLAKITLNTDEMISERQNFREEAFRKAQAKDTLNKILPWETLDAEREVGLLQFFLCLCLCLLLFRSFSSFVFRTQKK